MGFFFPRHYEDTYALTQIVEPLSLEVSGGPCGQSPKQTALNWVQEVDAHNTTYNTALSCYGCW